MHNVAYDRPAMNNLFVIHNVADEKTTKNLLCTMLHMTGPQRIYYAQCCRSIRGPKWNSHAEAIITFENEPNEHVLPIILFNYLVLKMVPSFEMNILGDYLSYLYSLLLWYPLSAFNLPGYGWKPIGILGIISTSNSKLLCPMCFCKRNKVCLPLIMKATQQFLLFITTLAKRVPTFLSWYMYMYELLSCNH